MRKLVLTIQILGAWPAAEATAATPTPPADPGQAISFETETVRLALGGSGEVLGPVDRQSGLDYADRESDASGAPPPAGSCDVSIVYNHQRLLSFRDLACRSK